MAKINVPIQVSISVEDVIEYLKKNGTLVEVVRCNKCKHGITGYGITDEFVFCSKPYVERGNAMHKPDWFCADGEEK